MDFLLRRLGRRVRLRAPGQQRLQRFLARTAVGFGEHHVETQDRRPLPAHEFVGQPSQPIPAPGPLADFLPTITIKAKDFANEITNTQVKQRDLHGESSITQEHIKNNRDVRKLLTDRAIVPEQLPAAEDAKKLERRLKSEAKQLPRQTPKLGGKGN